jgi:hypothetical protein
MRPILVLAAAATTVVGVAPPVPARADSYVNCSSQNYQRNWCPVYSNGRAYLDRQSSDGRGPCIEGSTWGQDRRGIWVDRGCRARFRVQDRYGQYPDYGYPDYNHKKDDTGALIGGLLIGGLLVGAMAAAANENNASKPPSGSGGSGGASGSGVAVEACRAEAVNQVAAYGQRPRIDRITTTSASSGGWTVQGYASVDVGPKAVSYAFTCRYDNGSARITKLN